MWDSLALQGSISSPGCHQPPPGCCHLGAQPRRLRRDPFLSTLAPSVEVPCREPPRRRRLPSERRPPARPLGPPGLPSASPSREPPSAATAAALPDTRYRNKADEGRSSLAFATARREVLSGFPYASSRTLHRADPASFEVVIRTLLCFASPFPTPPSPPPTEPCGPPSDASPGDFQRSPLRRALSKSPLPPRPLHRTFLSSIAAVASGLTEPPPVHVPSPRFLTALTAFASPTLPVYCNELPTMGFTVF